LAGARPPGLTAKLIQPRRHPSGGALLLRANNTALCAYAQFRRALVRMDIATRRAHARIAIDCRRGESAAQGKRWGAFRRLQKKKAAGQRPFSNAGWSSRGPRPRQGWGGMPQGTLRKHRSESHAACSLFQSCFVSRGNGFVGGEALGLWCQRNT
jgi:hypothetical protein